MSTYPSPFATSLIVIAIITAGVAAPLVPFIIIGAIITQGGLNSKRRDEHRRAEAVRLAHLEREKSAGLRYFAR